MDYREALHLAIVPGLELLPVGLDTPEARVMMLTIGMQESRFEHRQQIGGPAHGFWQFEKGGGVKGVLMHPSSRLLIDSICKRLNIKQECCYDAIIYNDALAAVFARLLLFTSPKKLPSLTSDPDESWGEYLSIWRPGKPHRETWDAYLMHSRAQVAAYVG